MESGMVLYDVYTRGGFREYITNTTSTHETPFSTTPAPVRSMRSISELWHRGKLVTKRVQTYERCFNFNQLPLFIEEGLKTKREDKGRRCCLGDRIGSIPCRTRYLASGSFEEKDEFILFFRLSWCNSSYSSYHPGAIHHIPQTVLVKNSQHGKKLNQFCPPNHCLLFCITIYPSSSMSDSILKAIQYQVCW